MTNLPRLLLGLLVLCALVPPANAQQTAPCSDPAYRQFDFWVGKWEVFRPDGKVAGTNRIEKEYGGCVLHERYATPGRYTGESLNSYDLLERCGTRPGWITPECFCFWRDSLTGRVWCSRARL